MSGFPFYKQLDSRDCGAACLKMISEYYGRSYSIQNLRERCNIGREGVTLLGISEAAESIGLRTIGSRLSFSRLKKEVPLPAIVHWEQNHFVVVYKISSSSVYVADPASGLHKYSVEEFLSGFSGGKHDDNEEGVVLLLDATPDFFNYEGEAVNKRSFRFLYSYLKPYKKYLFQLLLGLLLGSIFQLIFPFLTQSLVDIGINNQDIGFIYLVLIAQLVLTVSRASVEFIRSWIFLHITTRINISMVSDFLIKLMKLPLGFFDKHLIGDIMQRIGDHRRVESFLTGVSLNIIFSLLTLIVFSIVLVVYSMKIFVLFIIGSILYALYIYAFMKRRRKLDYKQFSVAADNQNIIIQLITGMQEIKLYNCEKQKRWKWESIQARLFRVRVEGLSLSQYQQAGGLLINESKNVLISILAAKLVIDGNITLGMMLAVQYIIGQLNTPVESLIRFFHSYQDAKISLERLGEIHDKEEEEDDEKEKIKILPENKTLIISDLYFKYPGGVSDYALKDINIEIPENEVSAIVGKSGSGKTTLIKLLLGFYKPLKGSIKVGNTNLDDINKAVWRDYCGAVLQDGFIFSDTIAGNIALGEESIDTNRLREVMDKSMLNDYISSLALGINTKIGLDGSGLSQGQKQRVLIARALYHDPGFLLFDEATNALDTANEKAIMENLMEVFINKTVVVVAHRLSTVQNADNIIVLEDGKVVENGKHYELIEKKGSYYNLIKDQLELGK
jgi:ATP-binding cassette subfamily B protein